MTQGDIFENLQFEQTPQKVALAETDGYAVMRIALRKNASVLPHMASHSAFFLVLQGKAIITSGDDEIELEPHQYISIDADRMRGIHALEDLVLLAVRD
jgi:quercetin dioxygenase-like cupin family protein